MNTNAEDFSPKLTGFQRDSTAEKLRSLKLEVGYIYIFLHNLPVWQIILHIYTLVAYVKLGEIIIVHTLIVLYVSGGTEYTVNTTLREKWEGEVDWE